MNDTGYISAFVYEKESFICSDLNNSMIKMINPVDSSETVIDDKVLILSGNDMTYLGGNVIYFALGADKNPNEIKSVFLDKIKNDKQQENGLESDDSKITDKGKIIVSTSQRQYIDTTSLKRISGIGTRIVDQNVYEEVLLTEIMAGNPDVDIYITSYGSYVASGVRDKKIYMPLNDSDIICNYMDKCFDYVAEAMKSQSGDIWALPISLESQVIWYVPENIDKFSIDLNEFTYLDSFFKLSEKIPKDGTYVAYLDYPGNFGGFCHNQYDALYNDYDNNTINFNTPLYKDLFDKVWTGWVNYSPLPRHPLFRVSKEDYNNEMIWETASFDKSKLIFKWSGIGDHLNTQNVSLDGWRALPMPRISSDVKKNRVIMRCAFINPYSKNKELALEYLESITKIPFEYSSEDSVFLFKDEDMYEGKYNTEQVAFIDIYNIINDGFLTESNYLLNYTIIDDYQNGRLTIDEAIAKIQREAEMWANE
ncbi:MAG: carbohydrate ABC transporter substrate-binding protein [Clostridiales bacterium]|nr:carbohydrate ABC transporter substrate-binding protein [Clostridiales bacterium]